MVSLDGPANPEPETFASIGASITVLGCCLHIREAQQAMMGAFPGGMHLAGGLKGRDQAKTLLADIDTVKTRFS